MSYGYWQNAQLGENGLSVKFKPAPEAVTSDTSSNQIFVVHTESGSIEQLTSDSAEYTTPQWSPDGRSIAFMSSDGVPFKGIVLGNGNTSIYTLRLSDRLRVRIAGTRMEKTDPKWSPDGRWIAFRGRDTIRGYVRREEGVFVAPSDGSGKAHNVTRALDRVTKWFDWAPDSKALFVSYRDGLFLPLARLSLASGAVSQVSPQRAATFGFAVSPAAIAWTELLDPGEASHIRVLKTNGRSVTIEEAAGNKRPTRRTEIVSWTNARGEELEGLILYPTNFDPQKRYALVVDTYGVNTISGRDYENVNYVKAAQEYFVFAPNHRAPHMWVNATKGASYDAAAVGPTGIDVMADDILSGIKSITRSRQIDVSRMCLAGFSNGGLQALQLLTKVNQFSCAYVQSPSTADWATSFFLETDNPDMLDWNYGIAPWQDPDLYTALIPLYHLDQVTTPVLLTVGDQEPAIIPTIETYNGLRFRRNDVRLIRYPNEGHGFSRVGERDVIPRIADFFSRHLEANQP